MANLVDQNPIILDSTGATVMSGTQVVRLLIWQGMTGNANVQLTDGDSDVMFTIDNIWPAPPAPLVIEWPLERPLVFAGGIGVASISSGRVLLYLM